MAVCPRACCVVYLGSYGFTLHATCKISRRFPHVNLPRLTWSGVLLGFAWLHGQGFSSDGVLLLRLHDNLADLEAARCTLGLGEERMEHVPCSSWHRNP